MSDARKVVWDWPGIGYVAFDEGVSAFLEGPRPKKLGLNERFRQGAAIFDGSLIVQDGRLAALQGGKEGDAWVSFHGEIPPNTVHEWGYRNSPVSQLSGMTAFEYEQLNGKIAARIEQKKQLSDDNTPA